MKCNYENRWEEIFEDYLAFSGLAIELNENRTEDFPNKYWLVDTQNVWDPQPIEETKDVFEGHPTIVDEIIDDLDEEIATLNVPESLKGEDGKIYYYWEAGYWGSLLLQAKDFGLEYWVEDHEAQLEYCRLIAFHTEDVDLEKFI